MEHLTFTLFTAADLAYLREAAMHKLPSAPRPPTMGADKDIPWGWLRDVLATPPAEVAALLNEPRGLAAMERLAKAYETWRNQNPLLAAEAP